MATAGETRAQREARIDSTLLEQQGILKEQSHTLQEHIRSLAELSDQIRSANNINQPTLEELRAFIASNVGKTAEPSRDASILGSGSRLIRLVPSMA